VKLIGATCHYVTAEPTRDRSSPGTDAVDHGDTVDEMMRLGRDVEKMVLAARALPPPGPRHDPRQQDCRLQLAPALLERVYVIAAAGFALPPST